MFSDAVNEYLGYVFVGLIGSVTMITCTVLALTRLVFHYKGKNEEHIFLFLCSRYVM